MVTPTFPSDPDRVQGGVMGVVKYLTDELSALGGIELSIVVLSAPPDAAGSRQAAGGRVHFRSKSRLGRLLPGTLYDVVRGKRELFSLLREIRPDVVHFQGCEFLAANCEWPHVLTIHGIKERDALWRSAGPAGWLKWCLLRATEGYGRRRVPNIIVISEYVRQFLSPRRRPQRTWFIENPVAEPFFDVHWNGEPGRVFACSSVSPLKNILGLIKAFGAVAEKFPRARLRIGGTTAVYPRYVEECRSHVERGGLQRRVEFLGDLSIVQVREELGRCNCLVIPSFQENAPLAAAEAMAVGAPVIGSSVGGLPHLVRDGETGLLVDPRNLGSISTALARILADRGLADSMGRRARELARERFRARDVALSTAEVYREVLADGDR